MAQEIEVKVKVATDQAVTNVNRLGDAFDNTAQDAAQAQTVLGQTNSSLNLEPSINNLRQLRRELRNTAAGTRDFDRLSMSIREMEDAIDDASRTNDDFLGQMESAPGILGSLGRGIRGAETATSSFSGALKATGIGLIVALLGGLVSAFSGNEVAMKKIQPLFDGLKKITFGIFKVIEPLVDVFMDLAMQALPYVEKAIGGVYSGMMAFFTLLQEAGKGAMTIIEGIFTLDADKVTSGIAKVGGSFGKAGDQFTKSMKKFGEGTKQLTEAEQEAAEKQKELLEQQAEKKKAEQEKAAALRQKEKEQQIAFNKEIADLEKQKAEQLRDINAKSEQEKLDLQKKRDLEEIEALKKRGANVTKLLEENTAIYNAKQKELDAKLKVELEEKQKVAEEKQKELDAKKADEEKAKKELATQEKLLGIENDLQFEQLSFEQQKQRIADRTAILLENEKLTANERTKIQKDASIAEMQIDELKANAKIAQANAAANTLTQLANLAGKDTAASKALGIASATINTYVGASEALKQKSTLPSPFDVVAKVANVATILATGFKTVKAITSVKVPGGGGGGGAPSLSSISAPSAMNIPSTVQPNANVVGASQTNQIAQTMAMQSQQPIKAYVVGNDVTTQQAMDRNIIASATLG